MVITAKQLLKQWMITSSPVKINTLPFLLQQKQIHYFKAWTAAIRVIK